MRLMRLLAVATAALLLSGCAYLFPPEEEILAPPLIEPQEVTYRTMEVTTGDIEQKLEVYANYTASLTASMLFEGQGGRVASIDAKLGQEVKQGDLLIELNSESLRRQIRQQEIEVEKARLNLENAQRVEVELDDDYYDMAGIEKAKINLEMEQNALELLEYEADKAYRQNAARAVQDELQQKIETQDLVIKKARIDLLTAEQAYERWLEEKEFEDPNEEADRQARVRQAELDLQKVQAALSDLEGDLRNAQLFAPIDGVVTYVMAGMEVGQNVEGYTTLFRISDPTQLRLTYNGDNAFSFAVGMDISVTIKSQTYSGKVAADPATIPTSDGKVVPEVYFVVDDLDEMITMGDSVRVTTILRREEGVVILPKNCINSFWGRKFVNLLEDGVKVERDVEVGIETSTQVQIVEGLEVGELVILP